MKTITHREMRNNSAEVLRRIEAGESLQVTNNGRLAALIVPAGADTLDDLVARGEARPARSGVEALLELELVRATTSTAEVIDDSRGRW